MRVTQLIQEHIKTTQTENEQIEKVELDEISTLYTQLKEKKCDIKKLPNGCFVLYTPNNDCINFKTIEDLSSYFFQNYTHKNNLIENISTTSKESKSNNTLIDDYNAGQKSVMTIVSIIIFIVLSIIIISIFLLGSLSV